MINKTEADQLKVLMALYIENPDSWYSDGVEEIKTIDAIRRIIANKNEVICKHCGWPHINSTETCDDATMRERGRIYPEFLDEREEFESHVIDQGICGKAMLIKYREGESYRYGIFLHLWMAWQARASLDRSISRG